jgi:cell wall-associated NlpC family hydrolase
MSARVTFAAILVLSFSGSAFAADPVELAADLIGRPYVWGAEGPNAFDCSGLMQYVFAKVGIDLPRRAIDQSRVGDRAGLRLEPGDLLFFSTDTRRSLVTHVGIYEGDGVMINASSRAGRVRRDDLDDEFWIERFMFARRIDGVAETRSGRRSEPRPAPSTSNRSRIAARALVQVAEILIRRR